jgi:hypothetical protein
MQDVSGVIPIEYLKEDGTNIGTQYGLIMSHYDQTVVLSPFNMNQEHFTHAEHTTCCINNTIIKLPKSRYSHPFLMRVWELPEKLNINQSSDLSINCPRKNHSIFGTNNKIDDIDNIDINFWHATLPSFFAHAINKKYQPGTVTYFNNKPTGMVVTHIENKSIIINIFTLKQIVIACDYNYAGIYYKFKISDKNQIYVAEDWDQYDNCLKQDDILLEIKHTPVDRKMDYPKLFRCLSFDTWITLMFMEKDNDELECRILRNNKQITIKIPRKPLSNVMQIPYYSDNKDKMSFELIHKNNHIEKYDYFSYELMKSPKNLFI